MVRKFKVARFKRFFKTATIITLIFSNLFAGFPIDLILRYAEKKLHDENIADLSLPTVVNQAKALTTTYDFASCASGNTCDTSTSWWASDDDVDLFPFANTAANRNDHTEHVDADYTALSSSNDARFASANPGTGDFIFQWFEMDITEDPADISQIDFTYEGATTSTANFTIWVKDDTTSYENDIAWISVGTTQSITANTETSFTRSLTGVDFANYIDSNGIITWAVSESVAAVVVGTDYVKMDVVTNTVEQEGYRWRNDDGSETTATWLAAQDTNITQPTATNTRLRTILNDTTAGNQATTQYQLEYKLSSDTVYRPVQASSGSVAYGSAGTASANQTTILQITAPATVNRGDLLVMGIANKYPNNGPTTPSGWTAITNNQASGGIGTTGLDTGLIYATVFVREAEGWEDSVIFSVNVGSANGSEGQILRYTKGNGKEWDLAATTGSDNTGSSNSWSVTGAADPGITAGDMVVVVSAVNTDLYNYSAEAIAATGLGMGTQSERVESASTGGDDMELVMSDHVVSSGTASTAPTFTMTSSGNSATAPGGASVIMRIRQVDAPIQLAASANITASGDNTTAQLTAPTGGPTFVTGRMMDDENPADTIDINDTQYTELEWSMTATSTAVDTEVYQFRVTANGAVLTDYTVTPQWTIGTPGTADVQQLHYRWRNDDGGEGANSISPSWYDTDWGYRQSIVIDADDVAGTADFTNFPALISFTDTDLRDTGNSGHVGQADGGDILFTNASGTKLDHELEKYTNTSGAVVAWVEIDTLDYDNDTTIYVYYGNASVADQENPTGVWDSNYKMVHHLEEGTSGATDILDSTSNANNSDSVTIDGAGSNAAATGKIGNAVQFDGSNDHIRVPDANSLDMSSSYTLSSWVNPDTLPGATRLRSIFSKTGDIDVDTAGTEINYSISLDQGLAAGGQGMNSSFESAGGGDSSVQYRTTLSTGTWYQVTVVFDDSGNTLTIYLNGSQVAQTTGITATPATQDKPLYMAILNVAESTVLEEYFDGYLDELQLSDTPRSADYVSTAYNNQNDPSTSGWLTSIGTEESAPLGASWAEDEDTLFADVPKATNYRLRIELSNEGTASDDGATHQLEVAETGTCSSGTYAAVPTDTSGDWQIVTSTHFTDGAATTNFSGSLTDGEATFVAGEIKDTGNTTGTITLAVDQFTEIEFSLQATTNATDGGTYCFRLTNTDTYTIYAQATIVAGASTFTQNYYRWYVDNDSTNPTDVWGNPDLAENATLSPLPSTNDPPSAAQELRLRVNITIGTANLSATSQQFKIQFKAGTDGSCTTGSWTDVGAAQAWEFASSSVSDGATITSVLSNSDVAGQYSKTNPTTTNANAANTAQDIEYDFHLIGTNSLAAKRYSFRVVESDGTVFTAYNNCPTLTTEPGTDNFMRHGNFFSDEVEQGLFW